jgi:hypothetical protein
MVGAAVLVLALVAAILLVAAELSPVLEITVNGLPCPPDISLLESCSPTGGSRHFWGLALLGAFGLAMAWGAAVGHSRPAAFALLAVGGAVLAIVLIADLPQIDDTGHIGQLFEAAAATPAKGFWLSLAGGGVMVGAGLMALLVPRR